MDVRHAYHQNAILDCAIARRSQRKFRTQSGSSRGLRGGDRALSDYRCVPIDRRRSQCSSPTKLGIRSSEYSKGDRPAGRSTHRRPHWSTNKGGTSAGTALSQNKPTVTEALRYGESENHQARGAPLRGRLHQLQNGGIAKGLEEVDQRQGLRRTVGRADPDAPQTR
jgi:hypothetical protein